MKTKIFELTFCEPSALFADITNNISGKSSRQQERDGSCTRWVLAGFATDWTVKLALRSSV